MAVTITDSDIYESGSGGFLGSHTLPDLNCSGTDSYAVAAGFNRNPSTDVGAWTFEGNAPTNLYDNENAGVAAVSTKGLAVNSAALTIISNTPSFKLQAIIGVALAGVDQSTPNVTTGTNTASNFGTTASLAYTGTAGNKLLVFVATQNDKTFTASNCNLVQQVTSADGNLGSGFLGEIDAAGSSQTIGATWTGGDNWRLVIIEVKAAGAPPPSTFIPKVTIL